MHYINPFDLLRIQTEHLSDIDSSAIRRAKKNLLAEIELSDNDSIGHNGIELTKSDCLRAIDELDNVDIKEFHFFIAKNKDLNLFLTNGELNFFKTFQVESIYKLPEFLDFISPFFSSQYDKQLASNFGLGNIDNLKLILTVKPITNDDFTERCYKSTYSLIKEIENEIISITKDIENKKSPFLSNDFNGLADVIRKKINIQMLNIMPSYFQSLRNSLAQTVRNLARDINNDPYFKYDASYGIIEIAHNLLTDGLAKQTISKGYYTIKKNHEDSLTKQPKSTTPIQPVVPDISISDEEDFEQELEDKTLNNQDISSNRYIQLFGLIILAFLGWALFNQTVKIIVLTLSLALFLAVAKRSYKKFEIKSTSFQDFFVWTVWIVTCIAGYFNYTMGIYFIFLLLTSLGHEFCGSFFPNKSLKTKRKIIYLIIAAILTYLFLWNNSNLSFPNNKEQTEIQHVLTDKDYFEKGLVLFNQSKYTEAITQYTEAIRLNPKYADAYLDRGACKSNLGKYEEAVKDYLKAEELGLKKSVLYSNLGHTYYQLKEPFNALASLEQALMLDPNNANAYKWRGEIKYDKNDNKGAVADYSLAIKYNADASNYFARGLAYYYLKEYKIAIQDMDKAIELNPDRAQYYFDRGDAKENSKDFYGACKDWRTAKEKGFNVPEYKLTSCTPKTVPLFNGEIAGCSELKPKYNRNIDNRLEITMGSNASAAVKMINKNTEKCIRYVFINKNTTYSIKNIPEGKYYLKIAYGEDWNILGEQSNCTGRFAKNPIFEKGEDILDYNLVKTRDGQQVPSFALKLDVIMTDDKMNSFDTDKINENDFYNE